MRFRTGLILLAILATGVVPSATGAIALTASSLSSPLPGTADLNGTVVHWLTRDTPTNSAQFELRADELRVETDSAEYLYGGVTAVGTTPPTTATAAYESVRATGANWYNETSIFVVPVTGSSTHLDATTQAIGLPATDCLSQPLFFPGARQPLCPDLSASFNVEASASRLTVNGSFDLFLWGWQGNLVHLDGNEPYWTGSRFDAPQAPNAPGVGPAESRFIKMAVRNGTLDLELAKPSSLDLFSGSGTFSLVQASFTESSLATASEAVVEIRRGGDRLGITVRSGTVTDINGQTRVVAPGPIDESWWSWWFALLLLPAALASWVSSRGASHVRRAADNLVLGNHAAAHRHAESARRWPWSRRRADTLAVIALLKARRLDEAEGAIHRMRGDRGDEAAADFLTAYLAAERGQDDAARAALLRAISANNQYRGEAAAHPGLRRFIPAGENP